jgi:coproporphyrinogen III oxidase-like Fe-S oxidoreductase
MAALNVRIMLASWMRVSIGERVMMSYDEHTSRGNSKSWKIHISFVYRRCAFGTFFSLTATESLSASRYR